MASADKPTYIDELASQAENGANRREQGGVYKITKLVWGKYGGRKVAPVKDVQVRLLTTERDQEARWAEHFKDVLNRPPPTVEADIQEAQNDKAPGQDNLNAELFKADPELSARILQPLFTAVWEQEKVPDDWTKGTIITIHKKGPLSDCNNWRGITLLSAPSKILAKIIVQQISIAVDQQLRQEQAGFRRGRGCADLSAIHTT